MMEAPAMMSASPLPAAKPPPSPEQQIFRADVSADFAGRDRLVQQQADRPRQAVGRIGYKVRVLCDGKRERFGHASFCGNKFDD